MNELSHNHSQKDNYTPLVLVFAFILILTLANILANPELDFTIMNLMQYFEGYFFVLFALFKFIDLKTFATGFSKYDLIGGKFKSYAYAYPFIELLLGLGFLTGIYLQQTLIATLIVSTIGAIGVAVNLKKKIQCACLGAVINLPLSKVSLLEYVLMGLMALYMLLTTI
jgi:hypothetical protein